MAKSDKTPGDTQGGSVQDMTLSTGDVRLLMRELGVLGSKVDRLITDVDDLGGKVDKLRTTAAYVQGALAALSVVALVGGYFAHGQFDAILAALHELSTKGK